MGAPERTLGAPGSVPEPMWESQADSERCLGSYGYSLRGLHVESETLQRYMSNQFPATANMMPGLLFIITSESYELSSSSTMYFLPCYIQDAENIVSNSYMNADTPK